MLKDTGMLLLEWWDWLGLNSDTVTSVERRRHKVFDGPNLKPRVVDEEFCCCSQSGLGDALHETC